jgi:hypothetical protein
VQALAFYPFDGWRLIKAASAIALATSYPDINGSTHVHRSDAVTPEDRQLITGLFDRMRDFGLSVLRARAALSRAIFSMRFVSERKEFALGGPQQWKSVNGRSTTEHTSLLEFAPTA